MIILSTPAKGFGGAKRIGNGQSSGSTSVSTFSNDISSETAGQLKPNYMRSQHGHNVWVI